MSKTGQHPQAAGVQPGDPWTVALLLRGLVLVAAALALLVPSGLVPIIPVASSTVAVTPPQTGPAVIPLGASTPTPGPLAVVTSEPATPAVPRVGVIAGHAGSDSGAVCPDGLQEAQINAQVADRVVARLRERGWNVDLFDEFDDRLAGYQADVLISIHADSCAYPGKTGFKVARAESSYIPGNEDVLVSCLSRYYHARTGLPFDANTITFDMTRYHAFYEIHQNTPAAVIEIGFMLDDRQLLVERQDVVALGIVEGLLCFLEGEPTP
ncbi:MAG: N-acetylmuramoyl-L-alanine amidase AmiC precursor [Chloroflexi bacterium ADurb.Bin222]|nr:MAG: N-acetylmuramoyl-L-alanine amidase AmiC precursor [Chloroflexi bacterium ADurb.Bin222]